MVGSRAAWGVTLVALGFGTIGCDGAGGAARPPSRPLESAERAVGAKEIALVLPAVETVSTANWEVAVRQEAGLINVLTSLYRPAPGSPPGRQAELIREAAGRSPSALIVVPGEPGAIASALAEVRDRGMPVVVLGREVPVTGKPLPTVTTRPLAGSTREMIAAARAEARANGFADGIKAVVFARGPLDIDSQARLDLVLAELKAADVPALPPVVFSTQTPAAATMLTEALAKDPDVGVVVADSDMAISAAVMIRLGRDQADSGRPFSLVGYCLDKQSLDLVGYDQCAGLIDLNLRAAGRQAVEAAVALADGRAVPDRIEVESPFHRATGRAAGIPTPPPVNAPFTKDHRGAEAEVKSAKQ
jgi:ABC-type sugar transport system substrate-binding protein